MAGKSHGNSHNQVGRPGSKSPIGHGHVDGKLIHFILCTIGLLCEVMTVLMPEGFSHAVHKEGNGDTSSKNHHEIRARRKLGFFVRCRGQLDVSKSIGDKQQKEEKDNPSSNEEPTEVEGNGGTPLE
jgi:hypothetical protein